MNQALSWMKSNPLTVACIAVVLAALVSFYWPTHVQSSGFRKTMASREQHVRTIDAFRRTSVEIPPARPDDPPTELTMVINAAANERLKTIYGELEKQFTGVFQEATLKNQANHEVMLDELFPQPATPNKPFDARQAYIDSFSKLYQSLRAGMPPGKEQVEKLLAGEADMYRRTQFIGDQALSEAQQNELLKRQADRLLALYRETAGRYAVYAPQVVLNPVANQWSPGAFQVGEWARSIARPEMADIWEGQMQLWIQQDLVEAIRIANHVESPQSSLRGQPVKRLMSMSIRPGYVGFAVEGAVPQQPQEVVGRLPADFSLSPTGRRSNPLYDVRHCTLNVLVDSRQIPVLLNALGQVNFMTVLGMNVTDIDEYAHLLDGYYYGNNLDVVQLELTIESIWLRSWTAGQESGGLMPDEVRARLGMPRRGAAAPQNL